MKKTNFVYNCKNYRKQKAKRKFRTYISTFIICYTLTTGFMAVNAYLKLTDELTNQHSAIALIKPISASNLPILEVNIKDKSIEYLKSRGFTEQQLFDFKCLMSKENRQYDPHAVYVNDNGSYDRGLMMWNSRTSPIKISNECTFDYMCSLEKFADYILSGGDWNRWFGYKNYCN